MSRLHVICRSFQYVTSMGNGLFDSGYWPVAPQDGEQLIGGMLYLHESKNERSYYGGIVERYREAGVDSPHPGRLIFTFRPTQSARNVRWQGRDDPLAWVGGVIPD